MNTTIVIGITLLAVGIFLGIWIESKFNKRTLANYERTLKWNEAQGEIEIDSLKSKIEKLEHEKEELISNIEANSLKNYVTKLNNENKYLSDELEWIRKHSENVMA